LDTTSNTAPFSIMIMIITFVVIVIIIIIIIIIIIRQLVTYILPIILVTNEGVRGCRNWIVSNYRYCPSSAFK